MTVGSRRPEPVSNGQIARLAIELWQRLDGPTGFPRHLEDRVGLRLPVAIHDVPDLSCARVAA